MSDKDFTPSHREPPHRVIPPSHLAEEMSFWRNGFGAFPQGYIDFHKGLADKALDGLKESGYVVHRQYMAGDGWLDGMRVLHAIVEHRQGYLFKLKWHDGNQEWFACRPRAGSSPLRLRLKIDGIEG